MIETKSELLELRDSLGWVDQKDQPATIQMLVSAVIKCLTEIDSLRGQVDRLGEIIHRIKNPAKHRPKSEGEIYFEDKQPYPDVE